MVLAPSSLSEMIAALRTAPLGHWAAKDLLRAAGLPPLKPKQSAEVAEKLKKIKNGTPISTSPPDRWDQGLLGHRRRVSPRIGRLPGRRGRTGPRQVALGQLSLPAEHRSTGKLRGPADKSRFSWPLPRLSLNTATHLPRKRSAHALSRRTSQRREATAVRRGRSAEQCKPVTHGISWPQGGRRFVSVLAANARVCPHGKLRATTQNPFT